MGWTFITTAQVNSQAIPVTRRWQQQQTHSCCYCCWTTNQACLVPLPCMFVQLQALQLTPLIVPVGTQIAPWLNTQPIQLLQRPPGACGMLCTSYPHSPHSTSPQQDSQQDRGSTVGPRIPRYAHDTRVPTASPSHESTRRGVLRRGPNGEPGAAGKPTTAAIVVGKPGGGSRGGSGGGVATPRADTGRTSPEPQLELRHILVQLLSACDCWLLCCVVFVAKRCGTSLTLPDRFLALPLSLSH